MSMKGEGMKGGADTKANAAGSGFFSRIGNCFHRRIFSNDKAKKDLKKNKKKKSISELANQLATLPSSSITSSDEHHLQQQRMNETKMPTKQNGPAPGDDGKDAEDRDERKMLMSDEINHDDANVTSPAVDPADADDNKSKLSAWWCQVDERIQLSSPTATEDALGASKNDKLSVETEQICREISHEGGKESSGNNDGGDGEEEEKAKSLHKHISDYCAGKKEFSSDSFISDHNSSSHAQSSSSVEEKQRQPVRKSSTNSLIQDNTAKMGFGTKLCNG